MKCTVKFFLLVTFLMSSFDPCFSYSGGNVILEGKVKSFSEEEIVLETKDDTFVLPRAMSMLPTLKVSQRLILDLTSDEFKKVKTKKNK